MRIAIIKRGQSPDTFAESVSWILAVIIVSIPSLCLVCRVFLHSLSCARSFREPSAVNPSREQSSIISSAIHENISTGCTDPSCY
jgi:hypothetical protein